MQEISNYGHYNLNIEITIYIDELAGQYVAKAWSTITGNIMVQATGGTELEALENAQKKLVYDLHINIR